MVHISRILIFLACCLFSAKPALATTVYTYSPKGPITMRAAAGDTVTHVIAIKNQKPYSTSVNVQLDPGGSCFSMNVTNYYIILYKDSTFSLVVRYVPTPGDTSHAWLRIYDSLTVADTVFFTGMDTTDQYTGHDWQIIGDSSFNAGDIFARPDSAVLYVKNFTGSSLSVTSTMLLGSYGFTAVGSQQRTIAAGSATKFYYRFDPKYAYASASIRIAGAGIADTVQIIGQSSTAHPLEDTLTFDYGDQYFGPIAPGDTAFRTASIYNWTDSAVTITDMGFLDDQGTLSLIDTPSLPYTIPVHDSLVALMRFIAPATPHTSISAYLYVESSLPRWQAMIIHGSSSGCVSTDPEFLWFGSVRLDSTATREVYVKNHTNDYLVIDSAYLRSNYVHGFVLNTHAPLTLAPNGDTTISISFTATSGVKDTATLVFTTSGCDVRIMGIAASIDSLNVTDTANYELFADTTQTLYFTGDSSFATQVFSFVNDLPDSLKIMGVSLAQGTHFQIFDIDPQFPQFTMGPADVMDVTLQFLGDPGTYDDTLLIVTETGIVALSFPVHGVILSSGVTDVRPAQPLLRITPNPSAGPVRIALDNVRSSSIEILDIMGTLVTRLNGEGVWNRGQAPSGTYFVRVTGVGLDGQTFVRTARLVLQ